jgi:acetyl/propionyl-CoA carboxylase alpha subunit
MTAAGLPVLPGTALIETDEQALEAALRIGFPIIIKASAGGGGRGMKIVKERDNLLQQLRIARSEAEAGFGSSDVYLERYLEAPRHIEVQIVADDFGAVAALGERECSIQRRNQKLIEEAPSASLDADARQRLAETAVTAIRSIGYRSLGTLEFLYDEDGSFYFMEMNTRLQVEHTVTELVTGLDLVREQIALAAGQKLRTRQKDIRWQGAAMECRIYAEDPYHNFLPSPGQISSFFEPSGPGIRNDSGVYAGFTIPVHYDPLISKLIAWGTDRGEAISRMRRALGDYRIAGIKTTVPFLYEVMTDPAFLNGDIDTTFIDAFVKRKKTGQLRHREVGVLAAAIHAYLAEKERRPPAPTGATGAVSAWTLAARQGAMRRY